MRWLLLDQIIECDPAVSATGKKTFSRSEVFFMDHFPGFPIVPGVLQIEMMAQMAGKCLAMKDSSILPVLGTVKEAKFYKNIGPGDLCVIKIKILKNAKAYATAEGVIEVDGHKVSSANILFGKVPRKNLSSESFDDVTKEFLQRQSNKDLKS